VVLEQLADRLNLALGIDASRPMLALARTRLAKPGLEHCTVRQGDMYRLPVTDGSFDIAVMQMVLHYAPDPAAALAEAARVLQPGGRLIVIDLAAHNDTALAERFGHRWRGFDDATLHGLLAGAGLEPQDSIAVAGPLSVRLWPAIRSKQPNSLERAA
jgi:ArsR family transcriptional regulator